ncbi:MAG TPA: YSC84-related protein [Methyloceanibacter sp.]|jgi:lipid-binding SYLF domain-containing protein|nr:YSC84-related protein [Methyloceanibacter sp.]
MNTLLKASCFAFLVAITIVTSLRPSEAASAAEIDRDANETLHSFVRQFEGARELANKAAGILVFPSVIKAGIGFGGEYGEGVLLNQQRVEGYYNLISASFGFQLGVQERSVIIMFMTDDALRGFEQRAGWKVGVDGSVAIITVGVGGSIDTDKVVSPVIGFILDQKGLMYNLTLEGSKISRINP